MARIASITRFLLNTTPSMSDLYGIDRNKGLYRVKITHDDTRKRLVMEAKNLRNNNAFNGVCINRDLTYKQRNERYERRQRNRLAGGAAAQPASQSAATPPESSPAATPLHN